MAISSLDRAQLVATPAPLVRPLVLWALRVAALVAAVVSGFLAWISLTGAGGLGCGSGFDCEEVLSSGWSEWFGLPVAIPSVSLYVSLLITLAFSGPLTPENVRRRAWSVSLALCALAGAAALWFIGLQLLVVGKFCSWCLTVHMCGVGAAALAIFGGRLSRAPLRLAAAVALSGAAVLAVGQVFGSREAPKLERLATLDETQAATGDSEKVVTQPLTLDDLYAHVDKPATDPPPATSDPIAPAIDDDPPPPPSLDDLDAATGDEPHDETSTAGEGNSARRSRIVSVFRGAAKVDVYQHPALGSPDAPHVIVKLFDYTCPHCRIMHEHLQAAREQFGDKLVVVMCPVPLNKQCNPHVQFESPKHAEACDLARLALAVWQADPAKFEEFDTWLFAPPMHPSAASARVKAIELVGEANLGEQLYSDALRERLAVGPKLYKLLGAGTVPKLLLPTGMLVGPGESTAAVMLELKKDFADRPYLNPEP